MTVTSFPREEKPKTRVWACNCGCENFWLHEDGRIECAECRIFHDSMTGYWRIVDLAAPVSFRVRQEDGTYKKE